MATEPAAAPTEEDPALKAELEAEAALMRKYGGLPRCNPMIAHSLKSGKHYFDSGDYALQQQLGHPADVSSGDQSQLPLAYDHHAANPSDADKATSQPPRLDKRPGVTSPRAASGSRPRSGPASPRGTCVASFAAGGGAGGPSGA